MRGPLTLLIIPGEGGRTYEYKLPRLYLWGLIAAAAAVLGLLALGLHSLVRADYLAGRVERLERDRAILAEEVASIADLEETLRGLKARNDQLRMLTGRGLRPAGTSVPPAEGPGDGELRFPDASPALREPELGANPPAGGSPPPGASRTAGRSFRRRPGPWCAPAPRGRVDHIRLDRPAGWFELSLDHGHGLWTTYAGMGAMTVEAGDFVQKGQPLGLTARSDSGRPGLRFRILENGREHTSSYRRIWL